MSSRRGSKSKRLLDSSSLKAANSPSSSTTSSSKRFLETSIDGQSSPASSSARSKPQYYYTENPSSKENVTVTVRFRPLSPREIRQGEEIAWYADGETILRNEDNPSIAYAYDRVFGPTTTTRHVYDIAAQHVVSGAMDGINGTIFAYGVTSSGKTHTMHGDQRSPGIIPLAVKDAFSIIQETPNREFLLRVSYLEIYNEVVNDLLNPAGQNLRIREDSQGTFVEGVKEEVVLSPAHALSLIAAGEEHRHVGSTNFNLLSSRSHTIFTLTIESSPCGENSAGEAVNLSQLHLIDLAGSESSKAETTGVRRKEGSYINKSLLTLGTVISKLTDGRATHIPYRDSKLTRLLQSSLSGHGRVSLICTVTPSSSSSEETHNTLKFAHRAKHIEILAAQNKIIDEKSLIKKYQNEIRLLKEELEQLKRGIVTVPQLTDIGEDNIVLLKQKLEDGQVKLQSRLEEEEDAKSALLSRIQRLTKLILVSSKASQSPRVPHRPGPRRRHSFGEEELAYLPHRRRDLILDDENIDLYVSLEGNAETADDTSKEEKKTRKHGLLNWLKLRKRDSSLGPLTSTSDKSSGIKSTSTPSTPRAESINFRTESRLSQSLLTETSPSADLLSDARHDRGVPEDSFLGQETPSTSIKTIDQIDLLREQQKILAGEVALHSSALKRLSEEAARNPQKEQLQVEIKKLRDEIKGKNDQIALLEKQIADSIMTSHNTMDNSEVSQSFAELAAQLNEKSFELEVKAADNRIIQEQLNQKICECEGLQETIGFLKQQLNDALELRNFSPLASYSQRFAEAKSLNGEHQIDKEIALLKDINEDSRLQVQAAEIEELNRKVTELTEAKEQLELRNQKLSEESSYAKGLASAAAVELKALSEEVAKLMNHKERLTAELAAAKSSPTQRRTSAVRNGRRDGQIKRQNQDGSSLDLKRELALSREREVSYEAALLEKDQQEVELQRKVEESKKREAYLENELANMWVLVAKLKKSHGADTDGSETTRETL
ncbi:kinesin-like protein KIN-7K [Citrus sinensis]|uniref:kinesin-like protein KIN-7K, chloroplastic n=1 Tax=Citrus sinensis TaxID=2711 RepID=UPI0003D6E18B|nr:kinesin-like protein KIN-7K, chloroplastic [Citrus sinensis]XP_015380895.1 kinesin-like protein KIN-7K, chloroplastic [Citrus sinensis]KAH9674005.1 kinesin-like protein KIN-7K [Citrus sinensis]